MFGQPASNIITPISTPGAKSTPFGQPSSTFGAPSLFGSSTPGTNNTSTGGFGFGSTNNTNNNNSITPGFGGNTNTGATSGFGGFGSTNTTNAFGSTTNTASASPFGAPAPAAASGGGLFGNTSTPSQTNTGGGLFGAPAASNTMNAFGQTAGAPSSGGFGFGASTSAAPATPGGGFFGAPSPANTGGGLFSAPAAPAAGGGLFGNSNTGAANTGFGANTGAVGTTNTGFGFGGGQAQQATGTASTPYQVTTHTDNNDTIYLQAITAMPAYQGKSFEELRVEDYTNGNKGSQGKTQSTGFGGFGSNTAQAPAPSTGGFGLFGSPQTATNNTNAFGAPSPAPASGGLFGAPAPAAGGGLFGAPAAQPASTGLFGAPAPAPAPATGLFGAPAPAPATGGLFGAPAAAPATGGLFGAPAAAPATGGLFGAPAPAPAAGGLFGAPAPAPATGGLFGAPAPAPATGGLFGAPAPAPATGGLFGTAAPAPAAGGLFGAPAPAPATGGGLFGAPAPAPATGGLFGAPAPAPATGGLFGAPAPAPATGGLFGAPAPAPATGGLFGAPAPAAAPGGLFGAPAPGPAATTALAAYVAAPPPNSDVLLAQQLAAVEAQKKELALLEPWRGKSPDGSSVIPSSISERDAATFSGLSGNELGMSVRSYASSSAAVNSFQSPRSLTRIRPRGFGSAKSHLPRIEGSLLRSSGPSAMLSPESFISSSAKRLVINPGSLSKPKMKLMLTNGEKDDETKEEEVSTPRPETLGDVQRNNNNQTPSTTEKKKMIGNGEDPSRIVFEGGFTSPNSVKTNTNESTKNNNSKDDSFTSPKTPSQTNGYSYELYREIVASPEENMMSPKTNKNENSYIPTLTKTGYTVSPPIEEMKNMSEADLAAVSKFSVERSGYGSVAWDGAVDVRSINLDSVVCIREREIIVYEAEEANGTKPDVGSKLNRPAVVTLHKIFPKGGKDVPPEVKVKFMKKIEKQTAKMDADFISYDPLDGIWKFRTKHFSRYGLDSDDDDDDDDDVDDVQLQTKTSSKMLSLVPGDGLKTASMTNQGRFGVEQFVTEDVNDKNVMMVSDNEESNEDNEKNVLMAAENAYKYFMEMENSKFSNTIEDEKFDNSIEKRSNVERGDDPDIKPPHIIDAPSMYTMPKTIYPDFDVTQEGQGLCHRIAQKCGMKTTTSIATDFSLRMRRSFRVGWRPDGSFIVPSKFKPNRSSPAYTNKFLKQHRPVLQESQANANMLLPMLQAHIKNSECIKTEETGCPLFELPKGLGSLGGSIKSYKLLCSTLDDYVQAANIEDVSDIDMANEDIELNLITLRALSLISTLYGQEKHAFLEGTNDSVTKVDMLPIDENVTINSGANAIIANIEADQSLTSASERRYEALISWLRQSSRIDTNEYIDEALSQNDPLTAILVALTGGDIEKACNLATENSYTRLALMISNGFQAGPKLRSQRQLWHQNGSISKMSMNLSRIYALLSGDLELEEQLYASGDASVKNALDWRQRLGMKLWFNESSSNNAVASMIGEYDEDISSGIAPPPQPRYKKGSTSQADTASRDYCILYRLLRLRASNGGKDGDENSSLLHIISPRGYTRSNHDYSLSFHVAALLQGLGVCPSLSDQEEGLLVENFASLLVNAGLWQWALYAMLCVRPSEFDNAKKPSKRRTHIEMRAKNFFFKHFYRDNLKNTAIRTFLEKKVGIPNHWFEEALATFCAYDGDAKGYIAHLIAAQKAEEATLAIERLVLPPQLILGDQAMLSLKNFLELQQDEGLSNATRWDGNNGCGAVLNYLLVREEVARLQALPEKELMSQSNAITKVAKMGQDLKNRIIDDDVKLQKTVEYSYIDHYMFASCTKEERAICFAKALAELNVMLMQIKILQSKVSKADLVEEMNLSHNVSELAHVIYSQSGGFEDISSGDLFSNENLRGVSSSFLSIRRTD